ncbi:hypothetical protein [Paenibacillus flagellatus]|uniref:Uncharacterized protein n=1 Tax=Paenibacillus flagellatus TaxID=2211139 RepID=A0A2V5K801_9BACL|nr:hypothetical protein [Paenibacillus flagellatus]PYI54962.1 hypothetical protein DLM86_10465 [Paenibacillus flagellatus]
MVGKDESPKEREIGTADAAGKPEPLTRSRRKRDSGPDPREPTEYETVFVRLSERVERILRAAIWTGLALLVAVQLVLSVPAVRKWAVKVERLEGVPFERADRDG